MTDAELAAIEVRDQDTLVWTQADRDRRALLQYVVQLKAHVPFEPLKDTARPSRIKLTDEQRVANYNSHKPRSSDASTFDEICELCGAKDWTSGRDELSARPCSGPKP